MNIHGGQFPTPGNRFDYMSNNLCMRLEPPGILGFYCTKKVLRFFNMTDLTKVINIKMTPKPENPITHAKKPRSV